MYQVIWDDDVYSEVASTWIDAKDRVAVIDAIREIDETLKRDPNSGTALSEGLSWVDCRPVRAIYSIDESAQRVKVHPIRTESTIDSASSAPLRDNRSHNQNVGH